MANLCSFSMQVNGKHDNIERFYNALTQNGDIWMGRGAEADINYDDELTKEHRIALVDLLNCECIINNQNHSLLNAIDKMISSYTTACNKKDYKLLKLPKIKPIEYHFYE